MTARQAALQLLLRMQRDGSYANLAVDALLRKESLSGPDAALCAALVYGVAERRRTLDYQLDGLLQKPLARLAPEVLAALRLGLYQLLFLARIPAHAAISESVDLVKRNRCAYAAGLVNAVLRAAARQGLRLPARGADEIAYLGIRYACPDWLVQLWSDTYGPAEAEALLAASLGSAPTVLRVNPLRCSAARLSERLTAVGIPWIPAPDFLPDALVLPDGGAVPDLPGFAEGWFHVQDTAAQLCCLALDPQPGETIFDLCAAPGGKTFTLAQRMEDRGRIVALDLHPQRVRLIETGTRRLGLHCVECASGDATNFSDLAHRFGHADRVLCDVPCSGLGILRKKPDIREKIPVVIDKLPEMQYLILCTGAALLRPGGLLLYATCTLRPAENEDVCRRFAETHPNFFPEEVLPGVPGFRRAGEPWLTLMPHRSQSDGFFLAAWRKLAEGGSEE
ncbi:MAG: 16S rRNA (cytosine(967)-C(5))-methyltransferase RsmB [Oscillospiraceae bacterium]|jgi:16S rRNA (cytosine967-C5)-methyltransferase|nr:16S rRNA (cytosine(967)-C(5))-methyltransferase RsmB [Oscillospiraceae bacterium]